MEGHADAPSAKRQKVDKRVNKKDKKAIKQLSPAAQLVKRQIETCASSNDFKGAYDIFVHAKAEDTKLLPSSYNVLLHLCKETAIAKVSKDASAEPTPQAESADSSAPAELDMIACSSDLLQHMKDKGVTRVEATYSELARIASTCGKPTRALELVAEMKAENIEPRLRSYSPAIQGFCNLGQVDAAFELAETVRGAGLVLTENEYRSLLGASAAAGRQPQVAEVLERMRRELPQIGEETASVLKAYFTSPLASTANGNKEYSVSRCTVNEEGTCSVSGAKLLAVDLTSEEREKLAAGIAKLACEREKHDHFEYFKRFLKEQGPYTLLIDGANVGMYGQNFENSGFNFKQCLLIWNSAYLVDAYTEAVEAAHFIQFDLCATWLFGGDQFDLCATCLFGWDQFDLCATCLFGWDQFDLCATCLFGGEQFD
eukprot:gene11078-13095_t